MEGPSLGNCFGGLEESDTFGLGLEAALKKDGGSSLSFQDFAFVALCAPPAPLPTAEESGLL